MKRLTLLFALISMAAFGVPSPSVLDITILPNVKSLLSVSPTTQNVEAVVGGFYVMGDGGGGKFRWDKNGAKSGHDGGWIIDPLHTDTVGSSAWYIAENTGEGVWTRVDANATLKGFGAKGDGLTDDTAAVQAAFVSSAGKRLLTESSGTFVITDVVSTPKNLTFVGANKSSVVFWTYDPPTATGAIFETHDTSLTGYINISEVTVIHKGTARTYDAFGTGAGLSAPSSNFRNVWVEGFRYGWNWYGWMCDFSGCRGTSCISAMRFASGVTSISIRNLWAYACKTAVDFVGSVSYSHIYNVSYEDPQVLNASGGADFIVFDIGSSGSGTGFLTIDTSGVETPSAFVGQLIRVQGTISVSMRGCGQSQGSLTLVPSVSAFSNLTMEDSVYSLSTTSKQVASSSNVIYLPRHNGISAIQSPYNTTVAEGHGKIKLTGMPDVNHFITSVATPSSNIFYNPKTLRGFLYKKANEALTFSFSKPTTANKSDQIFAIKVHAFPVMASGAIESIGDIRNSIDSFYVYSFVTSNSPATMTCEVTSLCSDPTLDPKFTLATTTSTDACSASITPTAHTVFLIEGVIPTTDFISLP